MFIALSQFTVMPGMGDEVLNAFLSRPHLVDNAPGYKKMEVLRPQNNPDEFWLMTWWVDELRLINMGAKAMRQPQLMHEKI